MSEIELRLKLNYGKLFTSYKQQNISVKKK